MVELMSFSGYFSFKKIPLKLSHSSQLEQLSTKQLNCDGAIEFLRLCQNFGLTPTFTKIDEAKSNKWKQSSKQFAENVIQEELRIKFRQNEALKKQVNEI